MAMGTRRRRQRQERLWISHQELAKGPGHPFYKRVNELLETKRFDEFAEKQCARFYAENNGRPSLTPGIYFRLLLVGYFEGIDSERGIAWRAADSFGLRQFLGIALDEDTPDHSTIRTAIVREISSSCSRVTACIASQNRRWSRPGAGILVNRAAAVVFHQSANAAFEQGAASRFSAASAR